MAMRMDELAPQVTAATQAIAELRRLKLRPARQTIEELGVWLDIGNMLLLYRRFFPDEWGRSTASVTVQWELGEAGYSEREMEFVCLVDKHMFPLSEFHFDSGRLAGIPVEPQGIEYDDDPDGFCLAIRAFMALCLDVDFEWANWLSPGLGIERGERDWNRFADLCRCGKGAVRQFPLLLQLVAHDTGNLWFDSSYDYEWELFEWDEAAMRHLAFEWNRARELLPLMNAAMDRIDAHPRYYLPRLVRLWNSAVKLPSAGSVTSCG
jgi:hypothetical protein